MTPISYTSYTQTHSFQLFSDDGVKRHNVQVLFNRERPGVLYRVDSQGCLVHISSLSDRISYYWNRAEEQAKVKRAISEALNHYNDHATVEKRDVQNLFNRIGSLSPHVLDRSLFFCQNKLSTHLLKNHVVRLKVGQAFHDFVFNHPVETERFIEIDLGNEKDNHNFAQLLKRQEGEIFDVATEGKLKKVYSKLNYRWKKKERDEKVQGVVSQTFEKLNDYLQRVDVTHTHKVVLKKLFTEGPLFRMGPAVYNRGAVKESSDLEDFLIEMFDSKLKEKREALKGALYGHNIRARFEHAFVDLCLEEFIFAQKLGLDLEAVGDGGSGGARYARDRFGKKILVVKPGDEGPHGTHNARWIAKIKRFFITPRECLEGNSEPQAEVDSYLLDRYLKIYQVPPTELRYVASRQFNGHVFKECSVQMYADGCRPLNEYVGFYSKLRILPRFFLRWYFGERIFPSFLSRGSKRREIKTIIPQQSAERLAVHNLGIEDIDCHLENVLVKEEKVSEMPCTLESFSFDNAFFGEGHNQELLSALLFSEEIERDGNKSRVTLIKHDGGSSNPYIHPSGYLATRFKHLFEVLPHYENSFSTETQELLKEKEGAFIAFLLEKGARALRNIHEPKIFKTFWKEVSNRQHFKEWVLTPDCGDKPSSLRLVLIFDLLKANTDLDLSSFQEDYEHWIDLSGHEEILAREALIKKLMDDSILVRNVAYLNAHLKQINQSIRTRVDSWKVIQKYLFTHVSMREVLHVQTQEDFEEALQNRAPDAIEERMNEVKQREVSELVSHEDSDYFVGTQVLDDLGESEYVFR